MNLDTGKAVQINILADKTGDKPNGQPWPARGVAFPGGPPKRWAVSTNWVRDHMGSTWLTVEGLRRVTRPSRPDPVKGDDGSLAVAPEHYSVQANQPMPHDLLHADALVLKTEDGELRYKVVRQPDKYLAGDKTGKKRVTAAAYAAGETEVEHYFTVELEG